MRIFTGAMHRREKVARLQVSLFLSMLGSILFVSLIRSVSFFATHWAVDDVAIGFADTQITILPTDKVVASALMRQGLVAASPVVPSVCFTTNLLELYRVMHLRCPQLSIQAFVKSFSDLHGVSRLVLQPVCNY